MKSKALMRWLQFLVVALGFVVPGVAAAGEGVALAVLSFEDLTRDANLAPLSRGLSEMMTTDLALSEDLQLVERAQLEKVLGELKLQRTAAFDPATAAKVGKGLGAAFVAVGSYQLAEKQLRIDVRVVDVSKGTVFVSGSQTGDAAQVFALESQLATLVMEKLGAKLTALASKRLGVGGSTKLDAVLSWSKAVTAQDAGDVATARAALNAAVAADPAFAKAKARLDALEARVNVLEKRLDSASEAQRLLGSAVRKLGMRDGHACLADLDAHDKADAANPSTSEKFYVQAPPHVIMQPRAYCMMLVGQCDAGRNLLRKMFLHYAGSVYPFSDPSYIDSVVDGMAYEGLLTEGYCPVKEREHHRDVKLRNAGQAAAERRLDAELERYAGIVEECSPIAREGGVVDLTPPLQPTPPLPKRRRGSTRSSLESTYWKNCGIVASKALYESKPPAEEGAKNRWTILRAREERMRILRASAPGVGGCDPGFAAALKATHEQERTATASLGWQDDRVTKGAVYEQEVAYIANCRGRVTGGRPNEYDALVMAAEKSAPELARNDRIVEWGSKRNKFVLVVEVADAAPLALKHYEVLDPETGESPELSHALRARLRSVSEHWLLAPVGRGKTVRFVFDATRLKALQPPLKERLSGEVADLSKEAQGFLASILPGTACKSAEVRPLKDRLGDLSDISGARAILQADHHAVLLIANLDLADAFCGATAADPDDVYDACTVKAEVYRVSGSRYELSCVESARESLAFEAKHANKLAPASVTAEGTEKRTTEVLARCRSLCKASLARADVKSVMQRKHEERDEVAKQRIEGAFNESPEAVAVAAHLRAKEFAAASSKADAALAKAASGPSWVLGLLKLQTCQAKKGGRLPGLPEIFDSWAKAYTNDDLDRDMVQACNWGVLTDEKALSSAVYASALRLAQTMAQAAPDDPGMLEVLAMALWRVGKKSEAQDAQKRLLDWASSDTGFTPESIEDIKKRLKEFGASN